MIEQKLIVGRFIRFPAAGPKVVYQPGDFLLQPDVSLTIEQSKGFSTKTSNITAGVGAKAHRNFKWLAWYPGAISEVALAGTDVLTGPMSGCWLVIYRRAGVVYAGHIGTAEPNSPKTLAVKHSWNQFAQGTPGAVIAGFNPARRWTNAAPPSLPTDGTPKIYGLFTTSHQLYSVHTYRQNSDATLYRISGIDLIPSSGLHDLSHI
jgi:hypothetical protein